MISYDKLESRVLELADQKVDMLVPAQQIKFSPEVATVPEFGDAQITKIAHNQIAAFFDIPSSYYSRILRPENIELYDVTISHFQQQERFHKNRLVRLYNDGIMRAFLSDRYKRIDNEDLLQAFHIKAVFEAAGVEITECDITDKNMYIRALGPEREVRKLGDVYRFGIMLQNSEVGLGQVKVMPFALRLACENGMVAEQPLFQARHIGERLDSIEYSHETRKSIVLATMQQLRDIIRFYLIDEQYEQYFKFLFDENDARVKDTGSAVKFLGKEFQVSKQEQDEILETFTRGEYPLSQYGLVQSITAVAKLKDTDRRIDLEQIGYKLATIPAERFLANLETS